LVVKDFELRKKISKILDVNNIERWTFVGKIIEDPDEIKHSLKENKKVTIGKGCFIYPAVWLYSANIGNDVIIHSMVKIAEDVEIGNGTFISGDITIAGSCKIGAWCFIGNNIFFIDHVEICDGVKLLPGTNIRKSITSPGTYYNPYTYKIEKIIV
jgi:UDP-3-O-[3-hydroxymyristoyl] glucosamine N-acyltransferase